MFIEIAKKQLQDAGFKLTKPRIQVIEFFNNAYLPVSAYDIVKEQSELDVVSTYRTIEILEKLGLVHKIWSLGGYVKCELGNLCSDHCCHEFQVCKKCHSFAELHGHHHHTVDKRGFYVEQHVSEQIGVCSKCK